MIELAVFLGNPGPNYVRTRHNVARILLEDFTASKSLAWKEKFHGRLADYPRKRGSCRFLLPGTFMNDSGRSVVAAAGFYKISAGSILVVHDDAEMPFGKAAAKSGGGLGGHRGLKSIRTHLKSDTFQRLRLGIGRPAHGTLQNWVLSRFDPIEEASFPSFLQDASTKLEFLLESP